MQKIIHDYKNISPIFDDLEQYYALTSEKSTHKALFQPVFDASFGDLQRLFQIYGNCPCDFKLVKKPFKKVNFKGDKKSIIVCFSGGKDSIACALHYKQLGYKVYLYHMRHINFALSDEYIHAQNLAKELNMPIYVDDIKLSGHHDWCEHPMKNIIIANGALNYGIREGITTKIAFGNYYTSTVVLDNFDFCGGDDMEMWRAYERIIRRIIPGFKMYIGLRNVATTLRKVCSQSKLLELSVSCLGRANLRKYRHDWVKGKFGINLPSNRCGSCYKCCIEYVYMADHGLQEYSEEYYKYCLDQLKKNSVKENGIYYNSIEEMWGHYFFYPIEESHLFLKC